MPKNLNISRSPENTFQIGVDLAKSLPPYSCVLLSGTLGAGKTQLIKGLCSYFDIPSGLVQSPTYSLHHTYQGSSTVHHFDLYRLKDTQEFFSRGFVDILDDPAPLFIEWPSKVNLSLFSSRSCYNVSIEILEDQTRKIEITYGQD